MSQKARPYNNFPVPNNLLKIQENGFHAPVDVVGGKNWVSVLHGVLLIGTPDPPITDVHWRRSPLIGTTVFTFWENRLRYSRIIGFSPFPTSPGEKFIRP
jgi:hypothetical protein